MANNASRGIAAIALLGSSFATQALEFDLWEFGITLTNRLSLGAAWRIEDQDPDLIGKTNLNPDLCAEDDCLGLNGDPAPNQRLVDAPGAFSGHTADDGNLNYDKGDIVAGMAKITSDLSVSWNDFGLKARVIGFFDEVNTDFDEFHPNTRYQAEFSRRDDEVDKLVGSAIELHDLVLSGFFFLGERGVSISLGQQKVRWGEANLIALNSINEINPPDARRLHQPGMQINEVFQPVPLAVISGDLFPDQGITAEVFYQLQWKRVLADPGGTFFADIDPLYRSENDPYRYGLISLGQFSEDPRDGADGRGEQRLASDVGFLLTDTSVSAEILPDDFAEPRDEGQFGARINWFAENFNNGTEFGFYYMKYHSRLPYLSFFAADQTPIRSGPSGTALDALLGCGLVGNDCLPIDSLKIILDYPEDIDLYGISFNTNIGSWSLAGEYSFRPNVPVQLNVADVTFAALQPAFPEEDIVIGAQAIGDLVSAIGAQTPIPGVGGGVEIVGETASELLALVDEIVGPVTGAATGGLLETPITVPGARNAAPDFIETRYRGRDIGSRSDNPYVPGFERLKVGQFAMTGIRIFGNSHPFSSFLGTEQMIVLAEVGFTHVVDMPGLDELQFNANSPNQTHYSGGADGTGQPGGNPDTRTFNPTQQTEANADDFSWGYRILSFFEYNDVFLGLNLKPFAAFFHDVQGYAPGPMQNFIENRKEWLLGTEIFYGQRWGAKIQYNGMTGNRHFSRKDRDNVLVELTYTF